MSGLLLFPRTLLHRKNSASGCYDQSLCFSFQLSRYLPSVCLEMKLALLVYMTGHGKPWTKPNCLAAKCCEYNSTPQVLFGGSMEIL